MSAKKINKKKHRNKVKFNEDFQSMPITNSGTFMSVKSEEKFEAIKIDRGSQSSFILPEN